MSENELVAWTVYEKPKDYPDLFVARKFIGPKPTHVCFTAKTLNDIRYTLKRMGFVCLKRTDQDEPQIVEVWI